MASTSDLFGDIESIDISGQPNNEDNTLIVSLDDVLNITDSSDTLKILGDSGDTLDIDSGWTTTGIPDVDGFVTYPNSTATLLADQQVTVI